MAYEANYGALQCPYLATSPKVPHGAVAEFLHFLHIARGSLAELETQYMIAERLTLISDATTTLEEIAEVGRLLDGLVRSLTSPNR